MAKQEARRPAERLRARQLLGKYRLQKRIGDGGFAVVYRAFDTIEGISVALKIPHPEFITPSALEDFQREARITARLDHPNILPLKNADFVDGHFVIVYPLGRMTLLDRMQRRMSVSLALDYGEQILQALAYAHSRRVMHCDVKPENFLLFADDQVRLADFGIAKVTVKTMLSASGSGTVGYVAPEQAMGRPSFRSDCFSAGLIIYRMLAGKLPTWPYTWPTPGAQNLRRKVHRDMVAFLRRAIEVDERKRFGNAEKMLAAFERVRRTARSANGRTRSSSRADKDWRTIRMRQFRRTYNAPLQLRYECGRCDGPVSEAMTCCPWCGKKRTKLKEDTKFPHRCRRCRRGMKLDWKYCAWCYGAAQGPQTDREYSDRRYTSSCTDCRGELMPFMKYCPWCRRKVQRKWKVDKARHVCQGCGWGVVPEFWTHCPWCARGIPRGT